MAAPVFTDADFLAGWQRLLPTGPIWPRDPGATQTQTLQALVKGYTRNAASGLGLLVDAFPSTTALLIPEWEASLGLPDPCTPLNPSTEQRAAAILAKFIASGGQSPAYFIAVAAALGFVITITEFVPFCADMPCDQPDYDPEWIFAWQVNTSQITTFYFSADESSADDPLETYDNSELACRLQQYAPAHTKLLFSFGGSSGVFGNDGGVLTLTADAEWVSDPTGLAAGAFWLNGITAGVGVVSIVPGATPDPTAPPIYFDSITPAGLLPLGGANLPLSNPGIGTGRIWNNGGIACVA